MPYNQRSFALKHHRGHTVVLAPCEQDYHYGQEPTWMVVLSFSYVENQRFTRRVLVEAFATMNAPRQVQIVLPGVHEQLDEDGYRPPANRVRILPTEKRRAAARSRANERKEPHGRLQLHRRWLIARTFGGLPNWSIKKEETRGD